MYFNLVPSWLYVLIRSASYVAFVIGNHTSLELLKEVDAPKSTEPRKFALIIPRGTFTMGLYTKLHVNTILLMGSNRGLVVAVRVRDRIFVLTKLVSTPSKVRFDIPPKNSDSGSIDLL